MKISSAKTTKTAKTATAKTKVAAKAVPAAKTTAKPKTLKGTKTEANLQIAFAGESKARNKYTYYASKARKEGYQQIADFFIETADNEKEHAKIWFKLLEGGDIADTATNLKDAAAGEYFEWSDMYAKMAVDARAEGFGEIADLFDSVGKIEKDHEARYLALLKNIQEKQVFAKPKPAMWHCANCGYNHKDMNSPTLCPVCKHPQSFFQVLAKNY
jgi:rubrerythrin